VRRRRPLHEELARAGGLEDALRPPPGDREPGLAAQVPDWSGAQRGEPGIHGVARARRWDWVGGAEVPGLPGDTVRFVVLADGTLLGAEGAPDEAAGRLVDAVGGSVASPYRAEAVRRDGDSWTVAASSIEVVEVPGLHGDEAELAVTRASGFSLLVDGTATLRRVAELERIGEGVGSDYVVRAARLDGELWEVEATPL